MEQFLDNPIYNALLTGNAALSLGEGPVKFFPSDVSPFAGLARYDKEHLDLLYSQIPDGRDVALFTDHPMTDLFSWTRAFSIDSYQLVYKKDVAETVPGFHLRNLTHVNVPQMLALTELTHPGPFLDKTIDFGHYQGIFSGDDLLAMAGFRLHAGKYIEISAVCTHPDHSGKGYARALVNSQINFIKEKGNIPYLHVIVTNERALGIYKDMGFEIRKPIYISVLTKAAR